ncbi:DUF2274 domain-containing protein [Mesorhizobium silamurunense]|uniref:DUF2274 domain-containing protein n=1 Tax=Mesorhizobium silamurunense TaxID=499528 RepID=UPI00177F3C52|nr:DUF2274 domain-containing protein [Mesorhizobium silamurunense]
MSNLKLGKLPDRTPSKITISVSAELNQALKDYAVLYRQTYGESESVAELIPYMLAEFLESDRAFAKARKEGVPAAGTSEKSRRQPGSHSE